MLVRGAAALLALGVPLGGGPAARGVVLTSNLTQPADGVEQVTFTRWLASEFSTDGSGYLVNSVTLRLQRVVAGAVEVAIFTDAGGRPGQLVTVLRATGPIRGNLSNVTFTGDGSMSSFSSSFGSEQLGAAFGLPDGVSGSAFFGGPTQISIRGERPMGLGLEPDTNYWVVTRAVSGQFSLAYTDSERGEGVGYSPVWAQSSDSGQNWAAQSTSPLYVEVIGDPANLLFVDQEAIISAIFSGLPMAMAQREAVFAVTRTVTRDVNQRLFRMRTAVDPVVEGSWELFATVAYGSGDLETIMPAAGFQTDTWAGTVGAEYHLTPDFSVGGAFTYVESGNALALGVGDVDIDGVALAGYVSYHPGRFYADFLYSYGSYEHEVRRQTLFGQTASAEPNSRAHTLQLNLGYNIEAGGFITGPYGGLDYTTAMMESYVEGAAETKRLHVPRQNFDSLMGRIGWQVARPFDAGGVKVVPQFRAGWAHEFRNRAEPVEVELATSPFYVSSVDGFQPVGSFATSAVTRPPGDDVLEVGAAVSFLWEERYRVTIDYGTRLLQADGSAHYVSLTGSVAF